MKNNKIIFLFIIFLISITYLFSMKIYIDNKKLRRYITSLDKDIKILNKKEEADLIFYNGITKKIKTKNAFDYTEGIENVIFKDGKELNKNILFSFENFKKSIKNITEIFKLYKPSKSYKYQDIYKDWENKILKYKNSLKVDNKLIFKHGGRYDYLLKELNVKYIDVDKYFVYKEKAYRSYGIKKVYLFDNFKKNHKNQLKNYGYNFKKLNIDNDNFLTFLKKIAKVVTNG